VMSGDLMHSPVQCLHPEWTVWRDWDAAQAKATRRAFLERHADTDMLVCTAHFPLPSAGRIVAKGDAPPLPGRSRLVTPPRAGPHKQACGQGRLYVILWIVLHIGGPVAVRTNIDIDDTLLAEAMTATGLRTKRKVVEAGLRLLARQKRQANAQDLFGRVRWEGDLHRERLDEPDEPDRRA
jgi:Arc/MetJ family transcription regulator